MSPLYRKDDRKYVHDVWFVSINQVQQIGAKALERINENTMEQETRTHIS